MVSPDEERAVQIKILHGLLDRLCSPDLTLGEAKVLRNQLLDFLERINPLFSEASKSERHGNDPRAGNSEKTGWAYPWRGEFKRRHPASSLRHRRVYLVIEFCVVTIGQGFRAGSKMGRGDTW